MTQIDSDSSFALLDVKKCRKALARRLLDGPIPVTIKGQIVSQWGDDDGKSIEFEVNVDSVEEAE